MLKRVFVLTFALVAVIAGSRGVAEAGPCESFNLLRFDPNELQRCIDEIKFEQLMESKNNELEASILRSELCDLAQKLVDLKSEVNDFIKETCVSHWEAAKKRVEEREAAKKRLQAKEKRTSPRAPLPIPRPINP
jgi:hypothetical protein